MKQSAKDCHVIQENGLLAMTAALSSQLRFKIMILKKKHTSSNFILWIFISVIIFTIAEIFYLRTQSNNIETEIALKQKTISIIGLPDLTLVTEAVWIRHRSIGSVFSVFPEDGSLLDYYPSSFVYNTESINIQNISTKRKNKEL